MHLESIAAKVVYRGSPEHKSAPSPAGPPRLRADAERCPPDFSGRFTEISETIRKAIRDGFVGAPIENGFPRYVWGRMDGQVYEARLLNSGSGEYKGYPLLPDKRPKELSDS